MNAPQPNTPGRLAWDWPRKPGLLIAGAQPGAGGAIVAGLIAHQLREEGRRVEVFLPIAAGCRHAREGLISPEAEFLAAWPSRRSLAEIAPLRFASPSAPHLSLQRAGRDDAWDALEAAYRTVVADTDVVVALAPAGIAAPLGARWGVLDLARAMDLPVIFVADARDARLGALAASAWAAKAARLRLSGVVVNRIRFDLPEPGPLADDVDFAMFHNPRWIQPLTGLAVRMLVPREDINSVPDARLGPESRRAAAGVDWMRLAEGKGVCWPAGRRRG